MTAADVRSNVESKLHEFVSDTLLFGQAPDLSQTTPLFELGVLDSMGTISLLSFIEKEFSLAIPLEEVEQSNLRDISTITDMIVQRL
jgi:acyl carrier protein